MEASPAGRKLLRSDYPHRLEPGISWFLVCYVIGVLYMFLALAIVCDEYFVPALEVIVENLELHDDVAGATFMAAGGSAPELFTSLVGTFKDSAIGFGTIVGSAVFNVLFVIAMCALFSKDELALTWWPLLRDSSYYTFGLLVLAYFYGYHTQGEIEWFEALVLFAMYGGYIVIMAFNETLHEFFVTTFMGGRESWVQYQIEKEAEDLKYAGRKREIFFRMGVLALLQGDVASHLAGVAVVTKIRGGVYETFNSIDKVKEGIINTADLRALFEKLELNVSEEELAAAQKELDENDDGEIDYEEFKMWYDKSEDRVRSEMNQIFDNLDPVASTVEVEVDAPSDGSRSCNGANDGGMCSGPRESSTTTTTKKVKKDVVHKSKLRDALLRSPRKASKKVRSMSLSEMNEMGLAIDEAMGSLVCDKNGFIGREHFVEWYSDHIFNQGQAQPQAQGEEEEEDDEEAVFDSLAWPEEKGWKPKALYIISAPVAYLMFISVPDCKKSGPFILGLTYEGAGCWFAFFGAILWIGIFSWFMVEWAEIVGDTLEIPPEVMGLTFLAAGTSVPDLLSSVIVAQQGKGDMAVSSSIGSNIFDILVGLPVPWLLYIIIKEKNVTVDADSLQISILVLVGMLAAVVGVVKVCNWRMNRPMGYAMLVLYVIFMAQDLFRAFYFN